MQLSVIFDHPSRSPEPLNVTKKLGQGKLSVYEVYSPNRKTNYALKVFPKNKLGAIQYNKEKLMFPLKHRNIIQVIPASFQDQSFYPLLTEYAKYGDFFDIVTKGCLITEVLVRTYFRQLVEGIEYIHSQGVAHLDLKLENIMLGSNFELKIIDFDQAQNLSDTMITSGGTIHYRAPEVKDGSCSQLSAADIYAAGIILYVFATKEFPFLERENHSHSDSNSYEAYDKDTHSFWASKSKKRATRGLLTQDLMNLIDGMWDCNPSTRFTIEEIKASKWYQGLVLEESSLKVQIGAILERKNRK